MRKKTRTNKKYYSKERKPFINRPNNNQKKGMEFKESKPHSILCLKKYLSLFINIRFIIIIFNIFLSFYINSQVQKLPNNETQENTSNNNNNTNINYLDTENKFKLSYYEKNIDYSNYSTSIKPIALYVPDFYQQKKEDSNPFYYLNKVKPIFNDHHQPRKPGDKNYINFYNLANNKVIKRQIDLAKSHGIYGFAIYFYWFLGKTIFDKPLKIIHRTHLDFHYMLIWKNENIYNLNNELLLEEKYNDNDPELFMKDIKIYLMDKKYIRIDEKPVIGIYKPNNIFKKYEKIIMWREKARELGIGEIYIITDSNNYINRDLNHVKLFDAVYESPPHEYLKNFFERTKNFIFFYSGVIYKSFSYKKISESKSESQDLPIYRGSTLEWDNSLLTSKSIIFDDYSPELFYLFNKFIINWTFKNNNESNKFIFINAWNNYFEGIYLEPDEKFGYASINALSKALFDLSYKDKVYNISLLNAKTYIAVQAHIFYQEMIEDIVNKTNNIPVKFDLFITTDSNQKIEFVKNYIKKYSQAQNYFIKLVQNKGRDLIPFLEQIGEVLDDYKYICHIHSQKEYFRFGISWTNFLLSNLLGSKELVSEILNDFEHYEQLGIVFPEPHSDLNDINEISDYSLHLKSIMKSNMNFIINKMIQGYQIENDMEFPEANMFWAKIDAIYQLFKTDLSMYLQGESQPLLNAIGRLWLYIAKYNGYSYKKILKYY